MASIKTPQFIQPKAIIQEREKQPDEKLIPTPQVPSEPITVEKPISKVQQPKSAKKQVDENEYVDITVTNIREVRSKFLNFSTYWTFIDHCTKTSWIKNYYSSLLFANGD